MKKIWITVISCILLLLVSIGISSADNLLICRKVDENGPGESTRVSKNQAAEENWKTAQLFWKQGNYKKAVEFAKKVTNADQNNSMAYMFIAWLYIKGNSSFPPNPREAVPYARKSVQLEPYSLPSNFWLGMAYLESGSFKDAMSSLEVCDKLSYKTKDKYFQPKMLYAKARIYAAEGDKEKALEHLKSAINRCTGFAYLAASQKDFGSLKDNPEFIKLSNYKKYDLTIRRKIENAISKAKFDNKRVLVHFSGDWGKNDNMLRKALKQPEISAILKKYYYYIRVDVGHFTGNMSLYREYTDLSAYTEVIPYIVIIDNKGEILAGNNAVPLKINVEGDYSPAKLKEFLKSFAE